MLSLMNFELYFAFVAATVVLMAIPGPNVALIAATSLSQGVRHGLATVAGTTFAMALQLAVVGAGLNGFLLILSDWFHVLRWCGALYLVLLGLSMWRSKVSNQKKISIAQPNYRIVFLRGFIVSLTNPKTLLFYGAFFPQFIVPTSDVARQISFYAITFIGLAVIIDTIWALAAAQLGNSKFIPNHRNNRLSGGLLIGAGIGLALTRKT
nr:MAG: LysE family translocator [Hyphomicrobiales bacterium]